MALETSGPQGDQLHTGEGGGVLSSRGRVSYFTGSDNFEPFRGTVHQDKVDNLIITRAYQFWNRSFPSRGANN